VTIRGGGDVGAPLAPGENTAKIAGMIPYEFDGSWRVVKD